MPRIMFQEVVCPSADASRKWYTLPLSFLVHTIVIGVLIVVPLVATDVLPEPRVMLNYLVPTISAVPVAPPPAPRRIQAVDTAAVNADAAPVNAPIGIGRETALEVEREVVAGTSDGLVEGLGAGRGIFDAPPPVHEPDAQPARVSSGIKPPTRIKDAPPVYPDIARRARVQGVVILEAIIGADGRVQQARVLRSIPLLDQAAMDAVQSWQYTPTLLNGRPVPIIMTVTVNFRLE
ncbi:MAG: energy transducer TonB [Vicinamibacterales bacterium]|nr:energy transducer TonB [Vicinamibacterales bacterium]